MWARVWADAQEKQIKAQSQEGQHIINMSVKKDGLQRSQEEWASELLHSLSTCSCPIPCTPPLLPPPPSPP